MASNPNSCAQTVSWGWSGSALADCSLLIVCSDDYALGGHNSILSARHGQWIRTIKPELMHSPKYQLHTAAQIQEIEARAMQPIQHLGMGIDSYTLMQRAGLSAFEHMLQRWPDTRAVSVVCGKGNNAGDGYIVARLAHQLGLQVQLIAVNSPELLQGDARTAYADFVAAGGAVESADQPIKHDLVVDALLGTGFRPPLRDSHSEIIQRINESAAVVLALDVPSGVDPNTGAVANAYGVAVAVRASMTVTFVSRKIGLYTGAGKGFVGDLHVADLGITDLSNSASGQATLLTWQHQLLPALPVNTYKHQRGKVVIVGGDLGMGGAVLMAAEAALRCGAGLVSIVSRPEHRSALLARVPEVMFVDAESAALQDTLNAADFIVIGPGLGRDLWGAELFAIVAATAAAKLIDADGLYWLAKADEMPASDLFITPHSGEAAKLLSVDVPAVEADRLESALQLARSYGCNVVLKGPGSVVVTENGVQICGHGGPGMATAGMGDVLAGICAGLMAPLYAGNKGRQGREQFAQAIALHSASADVAAESLGPLSVMATDVISRLPGLLSGRECLDD
ncbi:MAG: bifunctional ADP-dependent NAD(P)H-hydrate dehydratase/NAD(P)H-hydrate epimerase [Gammaproteobacteria bacterium]|nr:bifunctional ADP-dependent NAD(P)H-hydrate dehydratase/NAD(P)H-hydrate epimerase [Gammaproteobacteria bacterium]